MMPRTADSSTPREKSETVSGSDVIGSQLEISASGWATGFCAGSKRWLHHRLTSVGVTLPRGV